MPASLCDPDLALGEGRNDGQRPAGNLTHALWYGGRGGSGGYIRYLNGILATPAEPSGVRVTLICSPSLAKELGPLDPAVRVIAVPSLDGAISAQLWERIAFGGLVRDIAPNVLFYPSGSIGVIPAHVPVASICHNLLYFDDAEYRKYRFSSVWWRNLRRLRARHRAFYPRAAGIIFTSPYSQQLAARQVQSIKRWTIVPNGVERDFLAGTPMPTIDRKPQNILYVSTVTMYKHQGNVVKAIKQLRNSTGLDYQLRLAGSADELGGKALRRVLEQEEAGSFAHWLGDVSHDALPGLLRKADIFVFASSCEAFGITLLEAMASGLPIACSNRTGLPDLLRDGGVYFDPENCNEIASAIARLCADSALRRACAERAIQYARELTWSGCAEKTFAFLRDVASPAREVRTARTDCAQ